MESFDAVELTFSRLVRLDAWPSLATTPSPWVRHDLEAHVATGDGLRQLADFVGCPIAEPEEVVRRVHEEVDRGRIAVELLERRTPEPMDLSPDVAPLADLAEPIEETVEHTITIVMLDEDDKPVADLDYRVTLPDGAVVEGRLDAQGRAEVRGLSSEDPCEVSFPSLDADAWSYFWATPR